MNGEPIEIYADLVHWRKRVELRLLQNLPGGVRGLAKPIEFCVPEHEGAVIDPAITLSLTAAQQLMDALWSCGLRPTEGSGSAGSLAATERHLSDMRNISNGLLKKIGVDLP